MLVRHPTDPDKMILKYPKIDNELSDKDILEIFRKCFPRGLSVTDSDILYFAHKLMEKMK